MKQTEKSELFEKMPIPGAVGKLMVPTIISSSFESPVSGILISVAAVALLLFVIMQYSMGKINRKNIIETIQNENI